MPYIDYDGSKVYYNVEGEGEPLLLLHGNTVSSGLFKDEIPFFKQFYKVIYFDYPGHGKSERLGEFKEDFWRYNAGCALQILDMLGIDKLKGAGTSGGALVGLNMATIRPELFTHFIADSFLGLRLPKEEGLKIADGREKKLDDTMYIQYWKTYNGENWKNVVLNDLDMMRRISTNETPLIFGNLGDIKSKVLLIATSKDDLISHIIPKTQEVAELIPNSIERYYHHGRHTFMITAKSDFQPLAMDFFNDKLED